MSRLPVLALAGALLAGCRPNEAPPSNPGATNAALAARTFDARGVVREIASDRRRAVIRHEEIPGYMPRMTMELKVADPRDLEGIRPGDEIQFRLHATADTHWIDTIRRIRSGAAVPAVPTASSATNRVVQLGPGDLLPDAALLSETGDTVRLAAFRGRALAFTFFFTRCPLPDYCPRMNTHFRAARDWLRQHHDAPTNWQFLSLSFDADFDRPSVLAGHARQYRGADPDRWLFAAAPADVLAALGPPLDLMITRDGEGFSHNLRTVVVAPDGRIFRQLDGNEWAPETLAQAVAAAARGDRPDPGVSP